MTLLTIPPAGVPLTQKGDVIGRDWYRWAHDVTERCGGVTGTGTSDLSAAQFEDAGIEETKLDLFRLRVDVGGVESLVHSLAARIDALEREVMALKQGVLV